MKMQKLEKRLALLTKKWKEWDLATDSNGIILYSDESFEKAIGEVSIYDMIDYIQQKLRKSVSP